MQNPNANLGIAALFRYAARDAYHCSSSWSTVKEFVPAPWLRQPPLEFKPSYWWQRLDSNQPHTDFQSAALPDELRRQ